MRPDRDRAEELRRDGKSYSEIAAIMNIPRSTLSNWFSNKVWSQEIERRLREKHAPESTARIVALNTIRGTQLKDIYAQARREALEELEVLKYDPFFITGIMLYWGEGDKVTRSHVRMTNTDPEMMRLYVAFLKRSCGLPERKIRTSLLLYPDLDDEECLAFWSDYIGVPRENFTKSVRIQGRHKTKRVPHGICIVNVSSTYFKQKMLVWMQHLPTQLLPRA